MDHEIKAFTEALTLGAGLVTRYTGIPSSLIDQDVEKIVRWVNLSGKKWVTERLKTLKAIALQFLSGGTFPMDSYLGRKTEYKGKVIPALRMFSILIDCIDNNNWKGIRSVLDLINVYNVFMGPNDDVEEKIDTIIEKATVDDKVKHDICDTIVKHFPFPKMASKRYRLDFKGPDISGARYALKPQKNSDCLSALIPSLTTIPEWIFQGIPGIKEWVLKQPFFQKIRKFTPTIFADKRTKPSPYWAGNLAILGESGLKTRIVFVGNPWIQGILKPILVPLQRRLSSLMTDCTFNQEEGVTFLEEACKKGDSLIYSIDLSSATDNFPFFIQRFVAQLCGIEDVLIDIMEFAGFEPACPKYPGLHSYGKGQPMGLYPSFALFALTHNVLIRSLALSLGIVEPDRTFRVLGDDVLITNKALAERYVEVLNQLNIPISTKKTFVSGHMGEFAGQIRWKGYNVTPIKWRKVTTASLQVASQYLERGLISINEKKQCISSIPLTDSVVIPHIEALLPIPKECGGFGQLTRLTLSARLAWGRRNVRSLRSGYLFMVSERITTFLSGEKLLKKLDVSKMKGLNDQSIKLKEYARQAKDNKIFPMAFSFYGFPEEEDIPDSREGLKGLESIVFSNDSLEEQLGKYQAWRIAALGPNSVREFNRMITLSGVPVDLMTVPVITSNTELRRLVRVRHLPPKDCENMYNLAMERVKLLRDLRLRLKESKPIQVDDSVLLKMAGVAGATVINPALGVAAAIATIVSLPGDQYKDIKGIDKIVPVEEEVHPS